MACACITLFLIYSLVLIPVPLLGKLPGVSLCSAVRGSASFSQRFWWTVLTASNSVQGPLPKGGNSCICFVLVIISVCGLFLLHIL